MSYHQDWLMRQIEVITTMLAFLLTGKRGKTVSVQEELLTTASGSDLSAQLQVLTAQRKICEAENLLYEAMEEPDDSVLEAAVQFYSRLNTLSDQELEDCSFSREEILSGLWEVGRTFGINLMDQI